MADEQNWFPRGQNTQPGWRLDIISLLAVIGESAMADHAQTVTSTWLCLLPRLIPAPQALLKSERPRRLPPVPGISVCGAFSGTKVEELNFAANLIHGVEDLQPMSFSEYTIEYRYDDHGRTSTRLKDEAVEKDIEAADITTSTSSNDHRKQSSANSRRYSQTKKEIQNAQGIRARTNRLKPRYFAPFHILSLLSCFATIGLFAWSLLLQDGVAAIALVCMSLASTFTGLSFWWKPVLQIRTSRARVPAGDMVLKTRGGAFVVVHCCEEVARELYTGTDEVEYRVGTKISKVLVGFGTLFLMVAVVLLGNCNWTMQAAIGVAYLVLNGAYWVVSLLPERWNWHTAAYRVREKDDLPPRMRYAHLPYEDEPPSFTRTLWYAIHRSKSTRWLAPMEAAPQTEAWSEWIAEAVKNADDPCWPAVTRKNEIMAKHTGEGLSPEVRKQSKVMHTNHVHFDDSRNEMRGLSPAESPIMDAPEFKAMDFAPRRKKTW